ncbi:Hemin import ATP-binding protein HmuV [compost metagenome]
MLKHLRGLDLGIIASFHDLNLAAAFCDRLYVIDGGRIVASGTPQQVLTSSLLKQVFDVEALVDPHPLHPYPRITWITRP